MGRGFGLVKLTLVEPEGKQCMYIIDSIVELSACFVLSRQQAAARKLKPHPPQPSSLHERLLAGIKAERKLRPVSPDMVRRHRLGETHTQHKEAHTHSGFIPQHARVSLHCPSPPVVVFAPGMAMPASPAVHNQCFH